jgi:hypothetical protein
LPLLLIFAKPLLMLPKDFPQPMDLRTDGVAEDEDSALGAIDEEDATEENEDFGSGTTDDDDFSKIVDEEIVVLATDEVASVDEEISTTAEEIAVSADDTISRDAEDEETAKSSGGIAISVLTEDDSADGEEISLTPEEDSVNVPCVTSCGIADTELSSQFQMARATPSKQNDLKCRFILSLLCRFSETNDHFIPTLKKIYP